MEKNYENILKQNYQQQNEPQFTRKKNGNIIYSYSPMKTDRRVKKIHRILKKLIFTRSKKHSRNQKRFEQNVFSVEFNKRFDRNVYFNVKERSSRRENSFRNKSVNQHDEIIKNVFSFKNRNHVFHLNDVRFVSKKKRRLLTIITEKISSKKTFKFE